MFRWRDLWIILLWGYLLSGAGGGLKVFADEGLPIEISADISVNSEYLWRGFVLDKDTVMQEGIYISAGRITISMWGNLALDSDDCLDSDEIDYVIDYTYQKEDVSISLGHTYYDFPATDGASQEFYVSVGIGLALSPTLKWYYDYGDEDSGGGNGNYLLLELSHSLPLYREIDLDISGHIGYNHRLFIAGKGGDMGIGCSLDIPLTENSTLSPNINYSIPWGDMRKVSDGGQKKEFYIGVTLSLKG